jgi:uncharacterized protein (TIGR02611 family)
MVLKILKQVKMFIIGVIGFTILLIGTAMIVLPGPAFIVIPIGLGVLATEYVWARSLLKKIKHKIRNRTSGDKQDAGT